MAQHLLRQLRRLLSVRDVSEVAVWQPSHISGDRPAYRRHLLHHVRQHAKAERTEGRSNEKTPSRIPVGRAMIFTLKYFGNKRQDFWMSLGRSKRFWMCLPGTNVVDGCKLLSLLPTVSNTLTDVLLNDVEEVGLARLLDAHAVQKIAVHGAASHQRHRLIRRILIGR